MGKKKTNAEFKREIFSIVGNEYVFLDHYINNYTKLRVKHNKCGNIYKVNPNNFLNGHRCPYCSGNHKKDEKQFKREIKNLVSNEYTFLDTYVNNKTKIRVKHNKCGNVYKVTPDAFLRGNRCPYCSINNGKTDVQFKQEIYDLVGSDYIFLDQYVNSYTKLKVKHNKCGNTYEVKPSDFINHNTRCPYCNNPKGETLITKILDTFNLSYEPQKTFDDLKDAHPLSYDFYIPSQSILIEYQGIQHYQSFDYFGGEDKFKIQQKHDKMKADYAKSHNYNLIAIPYTEDTLSKIKKYLIKHGLSK